MTNGGINLIALAKSPECLIDQMFLKIIWLACMAALLSPLAFSQDQAEVALTENGVEITENGNVIRYLPAYFSGFYASNARDLLRNIPGVADIIKTPNQNNPEKRGFGSTGDQVLINGKRISGKANDIGANLERIPVANISSVEVIRGTKEGLDVRSEGLLVNIIIDGMQQASGNWQINHWFMEGEADTDYDGKFSYSSSVGDLRYQLSLEHGPYNSYSFQSRAIRTYAADNNLVARNKETMPDDRSDTAFAASASYPLAGGMLNVNSQVVDKRRTQLRTTRQFDVLDDQFVFLGRREQDTLTEGLEWELGGDYERSFGDSVLKTRAIYTYKDEEKSSDFTAFPVAGETNLFAREVAESEQTEAIIRSSYRFPVFNNSSLEAGAEIAVNTLDKKNQKQLDLGMGLEDVVVNGGDAEVEEERAEVFVTLFSSLNDSTALEMALNWETSTIEQQGSQVDESRTLNFLKPRLALRYDIDTNNQLRLSAERTVGQLNFEDFIAAFDDNEDEIDLGNPNLEPEKDWTYSLGYERRHSSGLFAVKGFYKDITDHVDKIEIAPGVAATGNIPSAKLYGVELKSSFDFGFIGLESVSIDLTYTRQKSEATDPVLGTKRRMFETPDQELFVKLQHDIASQNLSYWLEINWNDAEYIYEVNRIDKTRRPRPEARLFVEKKLKDGLSLWFNVRALVQDLSVRERQIFDGDLNDQLLGREERHSKWQPEFIIGLKGAF